MINVQKISNVAVAVMFAFGSVALANPTTGTTAPNVGLNAGVSGVRLGTVSQFKSTAPNVGLNAGVAGVRIGKTSQFKSPAPNVGLNAGVAGI